ncbi:MAG TPA: hypothetical protein VGH29_03985, partial [Candidatus Binataceae bacterium]
LAEAQLSSALLFWAWRFITINSYFHGPAAFASDNTPSLTCSFSGWFENRSETRLRYLRTGVSTRINGRKVHEDIFFGVSGGPGVRAG